MKKFITSVIILSVIIFLASCGHAEEFKAELEREHTDVLNKLSTDSITIYHDFYEGYDTNTLVYRLESPTTVVYLDSVRYGKTSGEIEYRLKRDNTGPYRLISNNY